MPYKDKAKTAEAMRRYRSRKKDESFKRHSDNIKIALIDWFQADRELEKPQKHNSPSEKIKVAAYSKNHINEVYWPVLEEVKNACPWATREEIIEQMLWWRDLTPHEWQRLGLDASYHIKSREYFTVFKAALEAEQTLRMSGKFPETTREFWHLTKEKQIELFSDAMRFLYDQGYSYFVSKEACYGKWQPITQYYEKMLEIPWITNWRRQEKAETEKLETLYRTHDQLQHSQVQKYQAFLRWCRGAIRQGASDKQIKQKIVEAYGRLEVGWRMLCVKDERKKMEESKVKMEVMDDDT